MQKSIVGLILLSLFANAVFTQSQTKNPVTPKSSIKIDPFDIKRGSSFSASISKKNPTGDFEKNDPTPSRAGIAEDFAEALTLIRANHVNGKNNNLANLTKTSIESMLHVLDPHSNFYDQREFDEFLNDQHSEYIGIGVTLENFAKDSQTETYITSVFPSSPASRGDLRFGDRIVSVDGVSASGLDAFTVREKIRGIRDTKVRVVVERAHNSRLESFELRRTSVRQSSVPDSYLLRKGIGYVALTGGFNYSTANELRAAVSELHANGMKALILDLRDNPGGIVEQAVRTAETFLPAGKTIVSQRGRSEFDNRIWKSRNNTPENVPLIVLVDSGSASASEILAGALQDNDRALIVGEKTFGKGLVQSVMNLPFGNGLTLTTARYYTPTGRSIQRDYSDGNLYGYYRKSATEQRVRGFLAVKTASGRTVYGGDGITPDETISVPGIDEAQRKFADPIFYFSAEILNGRITELNDFCNALTRNADRQIASMKFPSDDELLVAFRNFVANQKSFKIDNAFLSQQKHFVATRIRFTLATAIYGNIAANQILIGDDPCVARALDLILRAQKLALNARRQLAKSR